MLDELTTMEHDRLQWLGVPSMMTQDPDLDSLHDGVTATLKILAAIAIDSDTRSQVDSNFLIGRSAIMTDQTLANSMTKTPTTDHRRLKWMGVDAIMSRGCQWWRRIQTLSLHDEATATLKILAAIAIDSVC